MPELSHLAEALDYHNRGWCVIPCVGKKPRMTEWKPYQTERPSRAQVEEWWTENPTDGVFLVLGKVSGLVRLDGEGHAGTQWCKTNFPDLPLTPSFTSPGKGGGGTGWLLEWHPAFDRKERFLDDSGKVMAEFLTDGEGTVIPSSPHPDGGFYEWINDPQHTPTARIPGMLFDCLHERSSQRKLKEIERQLMGDQPMPDRGTWEAALKCIPADDYHVWISVGMILHCMRLPVSVWIEWSRTCPDKFKEGECETKWSGFKGNGGLTGRSLVHLAMEHGNFVPPEQPTDTDVGNAARLVMKHGHEMRYCHPWAKWLVWSGKHWAEDKIGQARHWTKEVLKELRESAKEHYVRASVAADQSDENDSAGKLARAARAYAFAMESLRLPRVKAALELAQDELSILPEEMDKDPWLFNCTNGTIDLRSGELLPHNPKHYITKLAPTAYHKGAISPRWDQFLQEVFQKKQPLIDWVQKLFGYSLTGDVSEQILPVFWGDGANGKSTLLNVIFAVMGKDYAGKAPSDLLVSAGAHVRGHPTNKATLFGMRLMAAIETDDGQKLAEATVKDLTGDDVVSCRRMREDFWTFSPTHKLVLATNYKPEIRGNDHAIWRRIRLVEFLARFEDGLNRDLNLKEKLLVEVEGVLAWMVDGCIHWQDKDVGGLAMPKEIRTATEEYKAQEDTVQPFIAEYFTVTESAADMVLIKTVMEKWRQWCGIHPDSWMSDKAIGQLLGKRFGREEKNKKHYLHLKEGTTATK